MHAFSIFVFEPVQRKSMFHMEKRSRNTLIIIIIKTVRNTRFNSHSNTQKYEVLTKV